MEQKANMGATAYPENIDIDQLCELVVSRLREEISGRLPSKQRGAGSNPARDATDPVHPQVILAINDRHATRSRERQGAIH